ncbi:MAG: N-carbamoylputrescine amidase [Clostridiales bacterium]|jgi:N-carbamoylputrescine amidase|nr:N-carbamoylputrescine amidase [Clostridiales bacterium]
MRNVTVAAIQMSCTDHVDDNISKADGFVRKAAENGAQIILLQELFETLYFCQKEKPEFYEYAKSIEDNAAIRHFSKVAKELGVVLPISFYERAGNALYNAVAVIDADGAVLGIYRKSHIPDGPGYEEKYYFNPGDTGFKVWQTRYATIGVGICWDQWFPEPARIMALMGAELLFYPTAIGSEPESPEVDSMPHWRRCMVGHSACNLMPVIASNRVGKEHIEDSNITFYGSSFMTDATGALVAEANRIEETILMQTYDLDALKAQRTEWGLFRDRRPELYDTLLTNDGKTRVL